MFKLILLIGLSWLSNEKKFDLLGKLTKKEFKTTKSNNYYVYLETNEFADESEIIIETTTYDGYFREDNIYYGEGDSLPTYIYLNKSIYSYKSSFSSSELKYDFNSLIYDSYSLYYKIPKPARKYLYISITNFKGTSAKIEISSEFPVWAIIVLVIVGIIIITVALIAFRKCRNKKK